MTAIADIQLCCGRPMRARNTRYLFCSVCLSTGYPPGIRLIRTPNGWDLADRATIGLNVWVDHKSRRCVTLHPRHPYANSAGYQRLARFLIAESLGYLPRSDEHTHHRNGISDDSLGALELVAVEYHGRIHASAIYVGRGEDGRFISLDPPDPPRELDWPRYGAILGRAAKSDRLG